MKNYFILICILFNFSLFAQSSIWTRSENIKNVQNSQVFKNMTISLKSNIKVSQPFSSSRNLELLKVYEISCECNETELYAELHKISGLTGIEYGPTYETLALPDDYSLVSTTNWALNLINAETAWSFTTGNPALNVAVSDQNYYTTHEELNGKINYYDNTNTSTRTHGTAVANLIAGNTNNTIGNASIGYNTTLSLYRMNYNDALAASYAGAKVINLSWTSGCSFNTYAQQAIDEIHNNGTFIVASAGNGTTCGGANNLVYPAAYDHVFAVTSIGSQDNIERIIGNPNTRHQTNTSVDICAPGYDVSITSAPGWYLTNSGTSFAAPFVTGTVALMLSIKPDLTNQEIDSILRLSATNINLLNPNYIGNIGSGRLNSGLAIQIVWRMTQVVEDGNNGHGNDEDGVDDSNPGNGGGNNGNGNGRNKPAKKSFNVAEYQVYDMNGKLVNIEYAPAGMYLVVDNGITISKIIK